MGNFLKGFSFNKEVELKMAKKMFLSLLGVFFIWIMCGYVPFKGSSIQGHDGIAWMYQEIVEFFDSPGGFRDWSFRLGNIGGSILHPLLNTPPLFSFLKTIGASPVFAMNVFALLAHWTFAFFITELGFNVGIAIKEQTTELNSISSAKLASKSKSIKENRHLNEHSILIWFLLFLVAATTPVIAYKVSYGHTHLLWGSSLWIICLSFLFSILFQPSLLLSLVSILCLFNGLNTNGYQNMVYSAVFGMPFVVFLISIIYKRPQFKKAFGLTCLAVIGVAFMSMPRMIPLFQSHALHETARGLPGFIATYEYAPAIWNDLAASFLFFKTFIASNRPFDFYHEVNVPFGIYLCTLLALIFALFRKNILPRSIVLGWATVIAVSLFLSTVVIFRLEPITSALLYVVSPLKSFRVPHRSWQVFLQVLLVSIPAVTVLLKDKVKTTVMFFGFGFIVAVSLYEFKIRSLPFVSVANIQNATETTRNTLSQQFQELYKNPFDRVVFKNQVSGIAANTASFFQLSSVQGYGFAPRRFIELFAAAIGQPFNPTSNYFDIRPEMPGFDVFQKLYQIHYVLSPTAAGLEVTKLDVAPIIPPSRIQPVGSYLELVDRIRREPYGPTAYIVQSDDAIPTSIRNQIPSIDPICTQATIEVDTSTYNRHVGQIQIRIKKPGDRRSVCLYRLPLNYLSSYQIEFTNSKTGKATTLTDRIDFFPVDGALLGVMADTLDGTLIIKHSIKRSLIVDLLAFFGLFLTIFAFTASHRQIAFNSR